MNRSRGNEVSTTTTMPHVEQIVLERYSAASRITEPSLCCAAAYDDRLLKALPEELVQRDYGCGNPTRFLRSGEVVLDLGCGGGKVCYISSQIVGPEGRVIGVDMNGEMLALARKYQQEIGERIGYHNVRFFRGRIQDLALDLERFEAHLQENPVSGLGDWLRAEAHAEYLRRIEPMIVSESIDCIVSNCVLNLVDPAARYQLFAEMFRVLRGGGRAVISDIVSDRPVPQRLKEDAALWSGCISGAYIEPEFLEAFRQAGFGGVQVLDRSGQPWTTVEGIEFRSVTIRAFKAKDGWPLDQLELDE